MERNNSKNLLNEAKEIAEKCRKLGLSNGGALGHHSGFADEVADCIESLLATLDQLSARQMISTKDQNMYRTPVTHLPNGDAIYVRVAEGEAIDIYRVNNDPELADDCLCFVEYNADKPEGQQLMVAAYRSCDEDTQYYAPYDQTR